MDCKNVLIKFAGGFIFSYGLIGAIGDLGAYLHNSIVACMKLVGGGSGQCFSTIGYINPFTYWVSLVVMAFGLVLLAHDFSDCCKPSKAKK